MNAITLRASAVTEARLRASLQELFPGYTLDRKGEAWIEEMMEAWRGDRVSMYLYYDAGYLRVYLAGQRISKIQAMDLFETCTTV
jgi:hypothetical protein